jgi:serine/threonine protein kinase
LSFNREAAKYFTLSNVVFERVEEGEGFVYIYPKRTNLRSRLHIYSPPNTGEELTQDDLFVDFVTLMLQVDPLKRPTAAHALLHPWLNDVDSLDVTYTDN